MIERLKICNRIWKIKTKKNLKYNKTKCHGTCDYNSRTIIIDLDTLYSDLYNETLIHELTHALLFELGIDLDTSLDEKFADQFGKILSDLVNFTFK